MRDCGYPVSYALTAVFEENGIECLPIARIVEDETVCRRPVLKVWHHALQIDSLPVFRSRVAGSGRIAAPNSYRHGRYLCRGKRNSIFPVQKEAKAEDLGIDLEVTSGSLLICDRNTGTGVGDGVFEPTFPVSDDPMHKTNWRISIEVGPIGCGWQMFFNAREPLRFPVGLVVVPGGQ
jgi:hypothetical protein